MADDSKFDIAMLFVLNGDTVSGESAMNINPYDKLMEDFYPIDDYKFYSNFFEVQTFDFTMVVKPDEENVGSLTKPGAAHPAKTHPGAQPAAGAKEEQSLFDRWRSASDSEYKKIHFPMAFDSFSFTRVIDGASPIFFQACANQLTFDSAALVKRVATGERSGVEVTALAFMRMDFQDVMLKSVKWQDGDLVTETCTFTCKKMQYRHRQQDDSGILRAPSSPATWDRDRDAQAKKQAS